MTEIANFISNLIAIFTAGSFASSLVNQVQRPFISTDDLVRTKNELIGYIQQTINTLQGVYDYIIYTDGVYVFAFNTKTKQIERIGTPEDVFNYVSNILNQNGGSVFVSGKRTDGERAVYTFNTQGIYINTHKKVEWLSDGAILQHNITVTNAQGQVGDTVTQNNLFFIFIRDYPDAQVKIKGFVIEDLRTSVPDFNPSLYDPEGSNRIITIQRGSPISQPYKGRKVIIEDNVFYFPNLPMGIKSGVIFTVGEPTGSYGTWVEIRNNLFYGWMKGNYGIIQIDGSPFAIVEDNILINTYQFSSADSPYEPIGIRLWFTGQMGRFDALPMICRNNLLVNCMLVCDNPVKIKIENNYIIFLPNSISATNPIQLWMMKLIRNQISNYYLNYSFVRVHGNYLITMQDGITGIYVSGYLNDLTIDDNVLHVSAYPIWLDGYSTVYDELGEQFARIFIKGNKIYFFNGYAIRIRNLAGGSWARNVYITDNHVLSEGANYDWIWLSGNFQNLVIKNNIFYDKTTPATYTYRMINHDSGQINTALIEGNNLYIRVPLDANNPVITITNPVAGTIRAINNINYNPRPPSSITVGASPFVYRNTDFYPEDIIISSGTVSNIEWSRDGTTYYSLGITSGKVRLELGEYLRVTYTTAPTMIKVPL
jgi:hypothetical protein